MRDTPGYMGIIAEVRQARAARERQTNGIALRTGDVILVVDIGSVQGAVWIAGQQWLAGSRRAAGYDPVVTASIRVVSEPVERVEMLLQLLQAIQHWPIGSAPGGTMTRCPGW